MAEALRPWYATSGPGRGFCHACKHSLNAVLDAYYIRLGREFVFVLYLGQLSHFPSCFGAGVTNLKEPPSSFLLPPHYCGLGAGSIPFRAIVRCKQCEMRVLLMSLVIHY